MVLIGREAQLYDLQYIFGKNCSNQYVIVPSSASPDKTVEVFYKTVLHNRGNTIICVQNEEEIIQIFAKESLFVRKDFYVFSDLKKPFLAIQKLAGLTESAAENLWSCYQKIYYAPHGRYAPCHHPFYETEITCTGSVYTCCSAIMGCDIGSIQHATFSSIWHSCKAKLLRLSVLNGTAIFCSQEKCQHLRKQTYPPRYAAVQVSDWPLTLNMAIDETCNLSCPSCRRGLQIADKKAQQEKESWIQTLDQDLYGGIQDLYVAGNGECMISCVYQNFLTGPVMKNFSGKLHLLTNGQIIDQQLLKKLSEKFCPEILISMDAASADTYAHLRRGGKFNTIISNIQKYVHLRQNGIISQITVRFVVQAANYREIPDFIRKMRELGVDRIEFTRLVDCGAFELGEFEEMTLLDENGKLYMKYKSFFIQNIYPCLGKDVVMDQAYMSAEL